MLGAQREDCFPYSLVAKLFLVYASDKLFTSIIEDLFVFGTTFLLGQVHTKTKPSFFSYLKFSMRLGVSGYEPLTISRLPRASLLNKTETFCVPGPLREEL